MKIGVWAYLDNNLGDDLMIKVLVENFPEHTFYLYFRFAVKKDNYELYPNVVIRDIKKINHDVKEISVFVTLGGSMFNNLDTFVGKWKQFIKILLLGYLKKRKIKIATLGCNINHVPDFFGLWLFKKELEKNDLVTVRDSFSYNLIKTNKWHSNCYLADDLVYLLNYSAQSKQDKCLGITIHGLISKKIKQGAKVFAKIIDNYIETTNNDVKIFAFNFGQEKDSLMAQMIKKNIKNNTKVKLIIYTENIDEVLNEFSTCSSHLAMRFLALILTDIMKIPCLPIAYANKMVHFLEDNNYKNKVIKIEEFDIFQAKILDNLISQKKLFINKKVKNSATKHIKKFNELCQYQANNNEDIK